MERAKTRERALAGASRGARVARARDAWTGEDAAIYCRISHVKDLDQTGVERQERICREIATRLGLVVSAVRVFVDNNRSAWSRSRKRDGWNAMLEAARRGEVSHIIAYHPDRLMRQPRDLEELLTIADERGITLHGEANHRDLSDPDDRFMLRIEVAHACRSSDDTSRRLLAAMEDRARDGKPHAGRRRFGYEADRVTIRESEAAIVREVFSRYLDGDTPDAIARDLTGRGVPTAEGRAWDAQRVRVLLDSAHVAGFRVFRGKVIGRGEWEPIISEGMFAEVKDRRLYRSATASKSTGRPRRFYLLRGLVMCERCGTGMSGSGRIYQCTRRSRTDDLRCARGISADRLEAFVSDATVAHLSRLTLAGSEDAATLTSPQAAAIESDRAELAELEDMWRHQEITTRQYRAMRKVVDERIQASQAKTRVRPAATVLDGLTGTNAPAAWQALIDAQDWARINAVYRFLYAGIIISDGPGHGGSIDYGRIRIDPNPL